MYENLNRLVIQSSDFIGKGKEEADEALRKIKEFIDKYILLEWETPAWVEDVNNSKLTGNYIQVLKGVNSATDNGLALFFRLSYSKITQVCISRFTESSSYAVHRQDLTTYNSLNTDVGGFENTITLFGSKDMIAFVSDTSTAYIVKETTLIDKQDVYFYQAGYTYSGRSSSAIINSLNTSLAPSSPSEMGIVSTNGSCILYPFAFIAKDAESLSNKIFFSFFARTSSTSQELIKVKDDIYLNLRKGNTSVADVYIKLN